MMDHKNSRLSQIVTQIAKQISRNANTIINKSALIFSESDATFQALRASRGGRHVAQCVLRICNVLLPDVLIALGSDFCCLLRLN